MASASARSHSRLFGSTESPQRQRSSAMFVRWNASSMKWSRQSCSLASACGIDLGHWGRWQLPVTWTFITHPTPSEQWAAPRQSEPNTKPGLSKRRAANRTMAHRTRPDGRRCAISAAKMEKGRRTRSALFRIFQALVSGFRCCRNSCSSLPGLRRRSLSRAIRGAKFCPARSSHARN